MSELRIDYYMLNEATEKMHSLLNHLEEYKSSIGYVKLQMNNAPGYDAEGYINTAQSIAVQKSLQAQELMEQVNYMKLRVEELAYVARSNDIEVGNKINKQITEYIGERNWLQKAGALIFSKYCDGINYLADKGELGKALSMLIRLGYDYVDNAAEKIYTFFKYDSGQYIVNIVKSVGDVIKILSPIFASAAIFLVGGPFAVIGMIGLIAGGIYLVLSFGGMMATVTNNIKALQLNTEYNMSKNELPENRKGSITAAKYYGEISGVNDWIEKTDMGGEKTNNYLELFGEVYDTNEWLSGMVSKICAITGSALEMGTPIEYGCADVKNWNWMKFKYNILEKINSHPFGIEMFFESDKNKNNLTTVSSFVSGTIDFFYNIDTLNEYLYKGENGGSEIYLGIEAINNGEHKEGINTILEGIDKIYEAEKASLDILQEWSPVNGMIDTITDLNDIFKSVTEEIYDFNSQQKNDFITYLDYKSKPGGGRG